DGFELTECKSIEHESIVCIRCVAKGYIHSSFLWLLLSLLNRGIPFISWLEQHLIILRQTFFD
ncbi:MAG: hypothetical protein ACJ70Z_06980, partial [Nitrososphaera sp.]